MNIFRPVIVINVITSVILASGIVLSDKAISTTLLSGGTSASDFKISPDSTRVVFRGSNNPVQLYSIPIAGGVAPIPLQGPIVAGGNALYYEFTTDGTTLVYHADQESDTVVEVFSVPSAGGTAPTKLNETLPSGGGASLGGTIGFGPYPSTNPSGTRVLYYADQVTDNVFDFYSVPIDHSAASTQLSSARVAGGFIQSGRISPDGAWLLYIANQDSFTDVELYSVPFDGSAPPNRLGAKVGECNPGCGYSGLLTISPDSNHVFFTDWTSRALFRVPINGSASPTNLSGPMVAGGGAQFRDFSPDGSIIVYIADQDTDNVSEVYSVPADGSAAPIKISGTLVAGGDAFIANIAPDGSTVIYLADQNTDGVNEIYSTPIDGSAPPTKLNAALVAGGDAFNFVISPDGSTVIYRADQQTDNVTELYSVPIDGSSAPVKLNGNLVSGGDVNNIIITPDSNFVIYEADQDIDNVRELFIVPIGGGTSAVKLNDPFGVGGVLSPSWALSPNGSKLLYIARIDSSDTTQELYSVTLETSESDPPVTSNLLMTSNPAPIDTPIEVTADVDDSSTGNSTIDSATYTLDGGSEIAMVAGDGSFDGVTESVTATLSGFPEAGIHDICVTGTDASGNTSSPAVCGMLVVYDPSAGFVTGGGWINSPPGAYVADGTLTGKAHFAFVSKYQKGKTAPTGNTEFKFQAGDLKFKSTEYEWLVVAGARGKFKGSGTINGSGNYGFMLTAIDAAQTPSTDTDLFRIKIWDKDNADAVVYDNEIGVDDNADPATVIGGGSIVIHTPKGKNK